MVKSMRLSDTTALLHLVNAAFKLGLVYFYSRIKLESREKNTHFKAGCSAKAAQRIALEPLRH